MTTMRDRIAIALCEASGLKWEDQKNYATSGTGGHEETEYYFVLADAVLAELERPSEEMVEAFCAKWFVTWSDDLEGWKELRRAEASAAFTAAIKAAREGK